MEKQPGSAQPSSEGLSPDQRQRLLKAKLVALVRDHRSKVGEQQTVSHHDEALQAELRGSLTGLMPRGERGFVLADFGTPRVMAGAMSWALQAGVDALTVFIDFDAPLAARFGGYFKCSPASETGLIAVEVRSVRGASSEPADPEPMTVLDASITPPDHLIAILEDFDLEVVTEHGVTRGEILGLEVARLVVWPSAAGGDDQLHLEVGVGRFDRDAVWAVNDGNDLRGALQDTCAIVRQSRYVGAPAHPLQRLARERWLRSTILREPGMVGADKLEPVGMTIEAAGMKDPHPAGAVGVDTDGQAVVVVSSTGVDLGAIPLAADLREQVSPSARLVLAVPAADVHPVQQRLAMTISPPAEVLSVPVEWS